MEQELKYEKILLVDDDSVLQHLYTESLQSLGARVLIAEDGEAGLEIASKEMPDLIITNIMMPKVNGLDLVEKLKSQEDTKHIPVIVLTALVPFKEDALRRGADLYLVKSEVYPIDLKREVLKLLGKS